MFLSKTKIVHYSKTLIWRRWFPLQFSVVLVLFYFTYMLLILLDMISTWKLGWNIVCLIKQDIIVLICPVNIFFLVQLVWPYSIWKKISYCLYFETDDFKKTFQGNIDDNFRIGLTVSKNTVRLYSKFYDSDIILASPLGLREVIGLEGWASD